MKSSTLGRTAHAPKCSALPPTAKSRLAIQGRVASREQVQVAINFPQHQEWVEIFKGWWKYGMREWRRRSPDDATLVFLCELGPPPYAITDGQQYELSNRWEESLQIRDWVRGIWEDL